MKKTHLSSPLEKKFLSYSLNLLPNQSYDETVYRITKIRIASVSASRNKKDEIAHKLGVHRSSLYRELRRNKWNPSDVYDAAYAQYRYELRKEQRVHSKKFTTYMEARAETMLVQLDYSPVCPIVHRSSCCC
ncbi:hypothetical protein NXY21_01050 [Bacteroides thetaiotaomicron]|uniref:hypothetical protein n=1 Tax=Bacteroides thetaiotaomicron TaxID=818 RepID=UPI002166317C|nr:hypothetical protein [Bacteroides thetaiotaomicron]MCS2448078.1 hypothetical protein [Bacteroides thetaiotaomicron]MCS2951847.1 hypothetical protein [Bacteroides thetaiotaomicron]